MEHIKWIFSGIGTEILILLIGLIVGSIGGYKYGVHKSFKQSQKAGDNSTQTQIGSIKYGNNKSKK